MIAEFGGLVNGVVPVLQPIAVRAVRPSEAAQGIVGIGIVPIAYKVPVAAQLPGGVVGPLGLLLPVIGLARQPIQVVVLVSDLQPVAVLRPGKVPVVLLVGVLHQGLAPGGGLQWIAESVVLSSSILLDPILFKHCKQKLNVHRVSIYTDSAPFGFQSQTVCTETIVHAIFIGYTVSFSQQITNKEIVFASG